MKKILLSTIVILLTAATGAWAQTSTDIVTKDNFYSYFDANGNLLDAITSDKLIFQGEFSNLVNYICLDRPITITGDNAVLNNIAIFVSGSDVTLDKLSVTYNAPDGVEAKAIFANGAKNFKLTNSEIIFTGTNPDGNYYRGLEVRNCDAAQIDNNMITATFPAVDVSWSSDGGIDQYYVLAVGIQGGDKVEFTNNIVIANTNGGIGWNATIDAVMVYSANDILIKGNNITLLDTATEASLRYYYSLDILSTTGTVEANDIIVNTTTDIDRAGTAYAIQLTGPFTVTVKDNNLTGISKGSAAAIYATNWAGEANLTVENNNIDVTGYITNATYYCVSGIEAQIDMLKAYNNKITVANGADYDDTYPVYGVSMSSPYAIGDHSADIQGNNMTVDGKYAVYYEKVNYTNVIGNALRAHELTGDDAVYIGAGEENVVKNNVDAFNSITTGVKSVENSNADVNTYSVTGVRVNTPSHLPKGIYIIGGKKVIVK